MSDKSLNLFEPIVDEAKQHPNFRNLLALKNGFTLDVLNDWARGFADRDGKFVREFQTTFNSSFWEIYLFAVLKKFEMVVDFTKPAPDFCLPEKKFNIEATVSSNAQGAEPEFARLGKRPPLDLNSFNLTSIIRLSNSLAAKRRKYIDSYARLEHVQNIPYVVAVANFDQPFSFLAAHRAIEAVLLGYYVDEERYIASGGQEGSLTGEALLRIFKDNGSPIELGLFTSPAYKEISAVIFSGCATIGKARALSSDPSNRSVFTALRLNPSSTRPHIIRQVKSQYEENLLDGLRIYHNPHAMFPLSPALFRHPSVFQWYVRDSIEFAEQREGQLLVRFVQTFIDRGIL